MKRWLILLFVLSFIPIASAGVVFEDNLGVYNIGDKVSVGGYIESNNYIRDIFKISLNCGNDIQLYARTIEVEANEKYFFNENVNLPAGYKGECNFRANFDGETKSSENFEISNELKGDMFVNKGTIRLGDIFEISGSVLKRNNDRFDGLGIIYLSKDGENYFVDTIEIFDSDVDYSTTLKYIPEGDYDLKLEASDFFGNEKDFDLGKIEINNQLFVDFSLDKTSYLPEDRLEVNGNVDANSYKILFEYDDYSEEVFFDDMDFYHSLILRKDVTSGDHDFLVKIIDEYGNFYEGSLNFNVIPVLKELEIKIEDKKYLPSDIVEIFVGISDQAGNLVDKEAINLRVLNPKKDRVLDEDINSGTVYGLENIEPYAIPGTYRVIAESEDFNVETNFVIDEYEAIEAYYDVEDSRLKIENVGNVIINRELIVYLDDEAFTFNLKNLKFSEIDSFNLRGSVKEGNYNLKVNFNNEDINVGEVYIEKTNFGSIITGAVVGGGFNDWIIYVVILAIIILVLVYFIYKPGKKVDMGREIDFREGQEKLKKRKAEKGKKKSKRLFPEIDEKDAKQFRESMVKKMKEK